MHQVVIRAKSVEIFFSADDDDFLNRQLAQWCDLFIPGARLSQSVQPLSRNVQAAQNPLASSQETEAATLQIPDSRQDNNIPGSQVIPLPANAQALTVEPSAPTRAATSRPADNQPVVKASQVEGNTITDFDQVLSQVMEDLGETTDYNPSATTNPTALIESLSDLCEMANVSSAVDTLLLAAYYLTFFEGEDRFSLKQINSQLLLANESSVSHTILANAMELECLTMLPDLTGSADVTEYQLTEAGRAKVEGWLKVAAAQLA